MQKVKVLEADRPEKLESAIQDFIYGKTVTHITMSVAKYGGELGVNAFYVVIIYEE
jgi:hypothetical protein